MLGNEISEMGRVSMVVDIGLSFQFLNDSWIKYPAPENPPATTRIQKSFIYLLVLEIHDNPWIVDVSKNSLISCIPFKIYCKTV